MKVIVNGITQRISPKAVSESGLSHQDASNG